MIEKPEYIVSIEFLIINFVRCNDRIREWAEHIFCVKSLCTYILLQNKREKSPNIFSVLRFCTRILFVIMTERVNLRGIERDGPEHIVCVLSVKYI